MSGPLDGIRVIDLTTAVLGPVATQILGDMGADVVKVETPGGDAVRQIGPARSPGMGAYFLNVNRNKRSLMLDLKRPAAKEALLRLAEGADVFVHNMRPGAARRLGIAYADIAARNPRIVYAWASGYRPGSSQADRPAFDDVIQGESGLADLIGRANGEPRFVPLAIADKFCGHLLASAIGMALFRRERAGEGQEVHVPMLDSMLAMHLTEHLWEGTLGHPEKGLGYPRMLTPYRRPYPTADGHICLLANSDDQWERLLGAIGRPELAQDPRFARLADRSRHIGTLLEILAATLKTRTTAEWRERLDAADVPNGPMNRLEDLLGDPYLNEVGFFRRTEHPTEGPMIEMDIPVAFAGTPGSVRRGAPRLGQHNAEILGELGYGAAEIAEMSGRPAANVEQ